MANSAHDEDRQLNDKKKKFVKTYKIGTKIYDFIQK